MSNDFDLANVLGEGSPATCPSCGAEQPSGTTQCAACGGAIGSDEDEPNLSVQEGPGSAVGAAGARRVPLERSKNYKAVKRAAKGILDGSVPEDEYRTIVTRMKVMAQNAVKVLESEVARKKFADAPSDMQEPRRLMYDGAKKLFEGMTLMEGWLKSHSAEDVQRGGALAEEGFRAIDASEELTLEAEAAQAAE